VGFLPATDPRVRSTIEAIERDLTEDGFVLRYRATDADAVDGLTGREGPSWPARSGWPTASMIGRHDDAVALFERLLGLRNDLGLLAEEYDAVAKRQVGNFPQAFSHVSLVNSAYNLSGHPDVDEQPSRSRPPTRWRPRLAPNTAPAVAPAVDPARRPRRSEPRPKSEEADRKPARGGDDEGTDREPLKAGRPALDDVDEPPETDGSVLVETLAVGICGTDIEITSGAYGWAPPGRGAAGARPRVARPGPRGPGRGAGGRGDLVVGIVRRPDPVPCANCAVGEWDFCRNGQYTERGIKERDGYCSERYRIDPDFVVKVDPASARSGCSSSRPAWWPRPGSRSTGSAAGPTGRPRRAVITGAGPIGLLAALIGSSGAWRSTSSTR
jgi:hypothetical protein